MPKRKQPVKAQAAKNKKIKHSATSKSIEDEDTWTGFDDGPETSDANGIDLPDSEEDDGDDEPRENVAPSDSAASEDDLDEEEEDLDELDELDGSDAESDAESEAGKGEAGALDSEATNLEKAQKRKEQKEMRQERKLKRSHGQEIHDIKQVWERLRSKTVPAEVRKKLVKQAFDLVDGRWKELVFRHDSSRVVQTVFKYANQEMRTAITNALKGSYVDLAKSSYGKYLLVKMLHYGNAPVRKQILDELHGNFRKLMKHREGAYVIEDAFRDYSTAAQRRQILREFYGSEFALFKNAGQDKANLADIIATNPDKRPFLMDNLNQVITAAVNKGSIGFEIIHAAMLEYLRNVKPGSSDAETFIDLITEQFAEMVHTGDGSQAAALILALASAKERKKLIKSLKPFVDKLAKDQFGNFVLSSLFNTVDDTVLVSKSFGPAIQENMAEFMTDKFARRPFLYLLRGQSSKYFPKDVLDRFKEVDNLKKDTSKKDDEARRAELLKAMSPIFYQTIIDNAATLVNDVLGIQFLSEVIQFADKDSELLVPAIEAVVQAFSGSPASGNHPLGPVNSRILKTLVKQSPEFAELLAIPVQENIKEWSTGEGAFVVVALLETLEKKEAFRQAARKCRNDIEMANPKGGKILLELLA